MAKKGAFSSGSGKIRRRNKDQATAAALKAAGIERDACNCPICHSTVALRHIYNHITTHK